MIRLLAALLVVLFAVPALAATSYQVNNGAAVTIDEFSTCKVVTNTHASGLAIFVPTATNAEWSSFYSSPPAGVSAVACDTTPDAFSFTDQTGVALNTLTTSNTVTITGINVPTSVSVSGTGSPQISINGGGWTTSGTISNGQTLQARLTSDNAYSTMRSATVTVGAVSDQWDVTTDPCLGRVDPSSGLVSYWRMDEAAGTTVVDSVGGHNGIRTGGSISTSGKINNALSFLPNSNYVLVSDNASLRPANITLAAWVKPASVPQNAYAPIIRKSVSGDPYQSYTIQSEGTGTNFYLQITDGVTPSGTTGDGQAPITAGVWQYIVGTYDGAIAKMYKNGVLVDSMAYTGGLGYAGTLPIQIGGSDNTASQVFNGLIDEVRLYNRALTAAEIEDMYMLSNGVCGP